MPEVLNMLPSGKYTCQIVDMSEGPEGTLNLHVKMESEHPTQAMILKFKMDDHADYNRLAALGRNLGVETEYFRPATLLDCRFVGRVKNGKTLEFVSRTP